MDNRDCVLITGMAWPVRVPRPHDSSAHGHTQTLRVHNGADALRAATHRYQGTVSVHDAAIPGLWAAAMLTEDDRYGTASGLVVQGDAIAWSAVAALETLA